MVFCHGANLLHAVKYQSKKYPQLNLPTTLPDYLVDFEGESIRCLVRNKDLLLTPEEWVRQQLLYFLSQEQGFPLGRISVEKEIKVNGLSKRWDILIYDKMAKPFVLVECKRPSVDIQKSTLEQAMRYQHHVNAPYLILSNGLSHIILENINGGMKLVNQFPRLR